MKGARNFKPWEFEEGRGKGRGEERVKNIEGREDKGEWLTGVDQMES